MVVLAFIYLSLIFPLSDSYKLTGRNCQNSPGQGYTFECLHFTEWRDCELNLCEDNPCHCEIQSDVYRPIIFPCEGEQLYPKI